MAVNKQATQALVLLAHGSQDARWKLPFESLLLRIKALYPHAHVALAYMEMTTPTLQNTLDGLPIQVTHVSILPLFMASGGHLRHDVPLLVKTAEAKCSQRTLTLHPPIGEHPALVDAMVAIAGQLLDLPQCP
jgi:sirohydrochlorin cobaltochelatase